MAGLQLVLQSTSVRTAADCIENTVPVVAGTT